MMLWAWWFAFRRWFRVRAVLLDEVSMFWVGRAGREGDAWYGFKEERRRVRPEVRDRRGINDIL